MTTASSAHPPRRWAPLLQGPLADRAADRAGEIVRALRNALRTPAASPLDASLPGGWAGLATLFAYAHRAWPEDGHDRAAEQALDRAAELVASTRMPPHLHGGFTGVAWATTHLRPILHPRRADAAEEVDSALAGHVARAPWRRDYDLVGGLVGYGVYALERLRDDASRTAAAACLTSVVERLAELAERRDGGATWHTAPELLPPHRRSEHAAGYVNLGVAHGVPGPIALLGAACAATSPVAAVVRPAAAPLLADAVAWLLRQRSADEPAGGGGSAFASVDAPGLPWRPARSAWCYGDPGVAAALLAAARAAGEPAWERAATELALRAARRPPDECGVVDAGLCHGAAGLAQIYNRLWQATGEERLRRAATDWAHRALDFPVPDDPGLLVGAAGVALALLAAVSDVEPEWDRVLLLSPLAPS